MPNRLIRTALIAAVALILVAGCSDDDDSKASTSSASTSSESTASTAPEDKVTPAAEVKTGLDQMVTEANGVADAGTDKAAAEAKYEEAHEAWEDVEGTVKQNEPDLYSEIEENLVLLKAAPGDETKARAAAAELEKNVQEYLAKYPG